MSTYILKMSSFSFPPFSFLLFFSLSLVSCLFLFAFRFSPIAYSFSLFAYSFSPIAFRLFKQSHSPPHKYNFVNFAGE